MRIIVLPKRQFSTKMMRVEPEVGAASVTHWRTLATKGGEPLADPLGGDRRSQVVETAAEIGTHECPSGTHRHHLEVGSRMASLSGE